MLLDAGADVRKRDTHGRSPLELAEQTGSSEIAETILKHELGLNFESDPEAEGSSEDEAEESMNYDLLCKAAKIGDLPKARSLIARGANVNAPGDMGWAPLACAANEGHVNVMQMLIDNGASIDAGIYSRSRSDNAAYRAASEGHAEALQLLIDNKCDLRASPGCARGDGDCVWIAAFGGHVACLEALIAAGADLSVRDSAWQTPLDIAVEEGRGGAAELLRQHGAKSGSVLGPADAADRAALLTTPEAQGQALCDAAREGMAGSLFLVRELLKLDVAKTIVNFLDADGMTPLDHADYHEESDSRSHRSRSPRHRCNLQWWDCKHKEIHQVLVAAGGVTSGQLKREEKHRQMMREEMETAGRKVLSTELAAEVRKAVEEVLAQEQAADLCQGGRMVGNLDEFTSGKFQDAARGIKSFLGVRKSWLKDKECTKEGIIAEVKRLCDCPKCAEVQARVLAELNRDREAEFTKRLATELQGLQEALNNDVPIKALQEKISATRAEIESVGGWVYGSDKSTPVDWPDDSVTHPWGKYGQPMCVTCKDMSLDYSTIWGDLSYILYETSSEKSCFNGIRDHGRSIGIVLDQAVDNRLVITQVWPDSPAAGAGIKIGDVLVRIDGLPEQSELPLTLDVARDRLRGQEGSTMTLQVLRASGLKWKNAGVTKPSKGRCLSVPDMLATALESQNGFTSEEWTRCGILDLRYDDFIKSGDSYFQPDVHDEPEREYQLTTRSGMKLADFMQLKEVKETGLSEAQLLALRFYTSHSFHAINKSLRANHKPHPLPATVTCIDDGIKTLRGLDAESEEATAAFDLLRGFTDTNVTKEFMDKGGSEAAPMSTTKKHSVACGYAVRRGQKKGGLLMKIVTSNNLQRGADLTFLSMFPGESETLYPPLTFVQPTGRVEEMDFKNSNGDTIFTLHIVEVTTTLP